jgi:hypothetical protein
MAKKTDDLEALLRARLSDPRAMNAALSINANRVFLTLGAVGNHGRIVFQVKGDALEIVARPKDAEEPEAEAPEDEGEDEGQGGGDDQGNGGEAVEPVDPNKHSKDELVTMAGEAGVEIKASATKADIADAINKARAPKE